MMFASLVIEREPLQLQDLPVAVVFWIQDAGIVAAIGLAIWAIAFAVQRPAWARGRVWTGRAVAFAVLAGLSGGLYALFFLLLLVQGLPRGPGAAYTPAQALVLLSAGVCAIVAVLLPPVLDLFGRLRWRRIWAVARLSLKEARAKGIIWICLIIPIIYLYADWYINPAHPKDYLAQRVKVAYLALTLLFIISAALMGSFSIPTDIKNQTIHTIVTKPVERYEIVLGRFTGYGLLLFVEMFFLALLSLLYVTRGLEGAPEAKAESYKARMPLFADRLQFHGTKSTEKGESVGREWDYRSYIGGSGQEGVAGGVKQYAIWQFRTLPTALANRKEPVRLEYSFDIFRTTKGDERVQGVLCSFVFAPGGKRVDEVEALVRHWEQQRNQLQKAPEALAKELGVYVARAVKVADYVTLPLEIPGPLFEKLYADQEKAGVDSDGQPIPAMQILVSLENASGPQLLGVARRDLYVLASDGWFWLNFLKGTLALWMGSLLVLGIALTCSTYLSGVISLLTTAFLCGVGLFHDYIQSLAFNTSVGGGPAEAAMRLANRQGIVTPLDRTSAGVNLLLSLDEAYRWYLRRVLSAIPDVTRYDLTAYVASGFDISWSQILFANGLIPLLGYLLPCAILAYYLINSKEIANPS